MRERLINGDDEREILIYAFRYALGRRTYAVHTVADAIRQAWPNLSKGDRELYQREIRQALDIDRAGMECDRLEWQAILDLGSIGER